MRTPQMQWTLYSRCIPLSFGLLFLFALAEPVNSQLPHQVTGPSNSVAPPAPGPGSVRGRIVPSEPEDRVAGLKVVLYSLRPDGTPGLAAGTSDSDGRFVFTNVSNEPNIVYLVVTTKNQVPFGKRLTFPEGQTEVNTEIELQTVRNDPTPLRMGPVTWALEWMGAQLLVQIVHQVHNDSDGVIYVPESNRTGRSPLFRTGLPKNMAEFLGATEGLTLEDAQPSSQLVSWGPFYPGEQELRYGFLAEPEGAEDTVGVEQILPMGADRVVFLVPEGNSAPKAAGLVDTGESTQLADQNYSRFEAAGVPPGGSQHFTLSPPPSSRDASDLRVTRSNYWIDHDDTQIRVNAEIRLAVDSPVRLVAPAGESLLHIDLPENAEFQGLVGASAAFGVVPGESGGLDIVGPLPPGTSTVGYRYRLPVGDTAVVDLRISKKVEALNVLVADNGVLIESDRLHRQRPFKQGTRFYLHRQAYHVEPDERVRVELTPLGSTGLSTNSARLAALAFGVLAALFLIAPLRSGRTEAPADNELATLARERESIYESIQDLEDDFETGKLNKADYESLRVELRASAVALLRQQETLEKSASTTSKTERTISPVAQFCSNCGIKTQADWNFCSGCGATMSQDTGST